MLWNTHLSAGCDTSEVTLTPVCTLCPLGHEKQAGHTDGPALYRVLQAEKALQSQPARQHLASAAAAVQSADAEAAAAALSLRLPMQTETVAALDEACLVARLKEQGNT